MIGFLLRRRRRSRRRRGRVLSPFEFLERFPPGQRIAFVGSSPSVTRGENGARIDAMDIVVRFNTCDTEGFEPKVGTRTDILCTHHRFGVTRFSPLDLGQVKAIAVFNNCFTNDLDGDGFWNAAGETDAFFTFSPPLLRLPDPAYTKGLTTGTQAVQLFGHFLQPKEVFVTGFTLFLDTGASDHYWEDRHHAHGRNTKHHEYQRERQIFCQVLNGLYCKTTATPDVRSVFDDAGIEPGERIRFLRWDGKPA